MGQNLFIRETDKLLRKELISKEEDPDKTPLTQEENLNASREGEIPYRDCSGNLCHGLALTPVLLTHV